MDYTVFQNNLRKIMDTRGMNTSQLAAELDTSPSTISRYLSGDRVPELGYIIGIASHFDVSIDWLLGLHTDRLEVLNPDIQDVISLYSIASPEDKEVVKALLKRYRDKITESEN